MYNWFAAADSHNIAPAGWHVPSDAEWRTLEEYLGGDVAAGGKMKVIGTIEGGDGLWYGPNKGATNESGFSALPGGWRASFVGTYKGVGYLGYWWSATEDGNDTAWLRLLYSGSSFLSGRSESSSKLYGFSVRCVRD
jgi:uncharacterized protein (TIGR02145 family)